MTPVGEKLAFSSKSQASSFSRSFLQRYSSAFVRSILSVALITSVAATSAAQKNASAKRTKPDPSAEFFADRKVRLIDIELSEPAKAALRNSPRSYIVGNVREGTQTFTNVG